MLYSMNVFLINLLYSEAAFSYCRSLHGHSNAGSEAENSLFDRTDTKRETFRQERHLEA